LLHPIHIKNAFLHGILDNELYREQPPRLLPKGSQARFVAEKVLIGVGLIS